MKAAIEFRRYMIYFSRVYDGIISFLLFFGTDFIVLLYCFSEIEVHPFLSV